VPWHADYYINNNHVLNDSVTTLQINEDGEIVSQKDDWDLQKWVNQVLPNTTKLAERDQPVVAEAVSKAARGFLAATDAAREGDDLFERLAKVAQDVVGWQQKL
jgi:hypothetical protein